MSSAVDEIHRLESEILNLIDEIESFDSINFYQMGILKNKLAQKRELLRFLKKQSEDQLIVA